MAGTARIGGDYIRFTSAAKSIARLHPFSASPTGCRCASLQCCSPPALRGKTPKAEEAPPPSKERSKSRLAPVSAEHTSPRSPVLTSSITAVSTARLLKPLTATAEHSIFVPPSGRPRDWNPHVRQNNRDSSPAREPTTVEIRRIPAQLSGSVAPA